MNIIRFCLFLCSVSTFGDITSFAFKIIPLRNVLIRSSKLFDINQPQNSNDNNIVIDGYIPKIKSWISDKLGYNDTNNTITMSPSNSHFVTIEMTSNNKKKKN
jgi:hypothetical protein